jgi:hypothetical protein
VPVEHVEIDQVAENESALRVRPALAAIFCMPSALFFVVT